MSVRRPALLRPLFQFRLRTLLLAVLAVSVALGWYVRQVELQRQAIAVMKNDGGDAFYDYELTDGKLDFNHKSPIPQVLLDRLGIDFFHAAVRIDLGAINSSLDPGHDDSTIERLADLPRLQHLVIANASDARLGAIGKLTQLERLAVMDDRGRVTDDGIQTLCHLPRLKCLWIEGVGGLTDDSLHAISMLQELEHLSIGPAWTGGTPPDFTDSGLAHLARLKNLRVLHVTGCNEREFSRLKTALPNCEVSTWCLLDTGTE
jgi:hypothetical protein